MSSSPDSQSRKPEDDIAENPYESDIDTSIEFDEATGIATFPSGTQYSVNSLDTATREAVINAINTSSKLALRGCTAREQGYVFLISETIDYHVRTPYGGGLYGGPSCSCKSDEQSAGLQHPCRHSLWVCDQIVSQLVPLPSSPYTWNLDGFPQDTGNVCDYIADYHFDVLADSLRCDITAGEALKPRPRRVQTAREILATLSETPVEQYRPDLTGENDGRRVVKEGDLEGTIFRMLLRNDSILSYFLASMRDHEPLNPRFRHFRDRTDTAVNAFDLYVNASDSERGALSKDPHWCYKTIKDVCEQIKSVILYYDRGLDDHDRRAAANTLVYILGQVVSRNAEHLANRRGDSPWSSSQSGRSKTFNLCRLLVESNSTFILDILDQAPLKEFLHPLVPELGRIEEAARRQAAGNSNIPWLSAYVEKLGDIVSRQDRPCSRSSTGAAESSRKRMSEEIDRYAKRVR
ncbi:hypothetical protein F5Y17DRAFT_466509 [Xylariaceae sp. FL0594]|nr:hypothetical protein F5Y17DRAFT_466509 [Xylariaceae sp. FL0594]